MALRAVCPRCRRRYDDTARVCAIDGTILVSDGDFPGGAAPESPGPPSLRPATPRGLSGAAASRGPLRPAPPPSPAGSALPARELTDPQFPAAGSGEAPPRPRPDVPPLRTQPAPPLRQTGSHQPLRQTGSHQPLRQTGSHQPLRQSGTHPRPFDPVPRDGPPGERLGPYRLLRQLGEGGMARIYQAEHEKLGRIFAIKRLHSDHFADRLTVARFLAEARAVGAIHHPNLVAAFDVVEEPNEIYLVMEYLDGRDVAQVLHAEGPLPALRAAEIVAQACDGLAAVHAQNIIHRDLKPENIFLTRDIEGRERVKLLDFGVARLIGDRPRELKTRSGLTVGTPTYMSPEQATASEIDARSDIYTVGVVLYEMLSGRPPFTGAGYGDVMLMHVNDAPPRLSTRRSDLPPWLESVVMRCLEKDPASRFQSATELATALRTAGRERPVGAGEGRAPIRTRSRSMRAVWPWRRVAIGGGAGALLLLAIVIAALTWRRQQPRSEIVESPPPAPAQIAPVAPMPEPAQAPPVTPIVAATTTAPAPAPAPAPVARPPARVRVDTVPPHALVTVAGSRPCRAPCDVLVAPAAAAVDVRATSPGYLDESRRLDGRDLPARVHLVLKRASRSAPGGAAGQLAPERTRRQRSVTPSQGKTLDPFSPR